MLTHDRSLISSAPPFVPQLAHLASLIDSVVATPGGFLEIELFNTDQKLVVQTDDIRESQDEILAQHKIPVDRYL